MSHQIPNLITLLRLGLLPLFVQLTLQCRDVVVEGGDPSAWQRFGPLLLLAVIAASDVVDGYLARRFRWTTKLGAFLDPLADKLTQATGLVVYTFFAEPAWPGIPPAILCLILARDFVLAGGSIHLRLRGQLQIQPRWTGKVATLLTFALLLAVSARLPALLREVLVYLSGVSIVVSAFHYFAIGRVTLRQGVETAPGEASP